MDAPLKKKTIKVELELTVDIEDLSNVESFLDETSDHLPYLQRLQEALLNDEESLRLVILPAVFAKLQEFADYAAGQDSSRTIRELIGTLEEKDRQFWEHLEADFLEVTRPLTSSIIKVQIEKSSVLEKAADANNGTAWLPVWSDLRPRTPLGKQMDRLGVPYLPVSIHSEIDRDHYLLVRYIVERNQKVHVEGTCSCGHLFHSEAVDESTAVEHLWDQHARHKSSSRAIRSALEAWRPGTDLALWKD
jgi:hypothetical protein